MRIKCTDSLNNVSYITKRNGAVSCVLSNGTPASLFYAGISGDEMAVKFALEDANTDIEALEVVKKMGSWRTIYELA